MTPKRYFFAVVFCLAAALAYPLSITVAPTTGVSGTAVTNSIENAITQINAGADATNTIVLRSTEGAIVLPAMTTWTINAGKSISFVAESGQPILVLTWTTGRYMLTITAGTNANAQTETISFDGIAFIPQTGLTYANNVADGINCAAGKFIFTNCVFSFNNGSNGVASQEGNVAYTGTNGVGDDWIQVNSYNDATFSNCTFTGCYDDAVLFGGSLSPGPASVCKIDKGTCIANVGGAGVQIFGNYSALDIDGTNGRVLIAKTGLDAHGTDVGVKFFADTGCSWSMKKTDVIDTTNSALADFYGGTPTIQWTDCRVAFGNSGDVATVGLYSVTEQEATPDSGDVIQNIQITRCTFHDTLAATNVDAFYAGESANNNAQQFVIIDSIFSGAGDSYANMTNSIATVGASPAVAKTFTAVVTSGANAIANVGDLGAGSPSDDPAYVSTTYTIGRSQSNPDFLLPSAASYAAASSTGGLLRGGAPYTTAVADWMMF